MFQFFERLMVLMHSLGRSVWLSLGMTGLIIGVVIVGQANAQNPALQNVSEASKAKLIASNSTIAQPSNIAALKATGGSQISPSATTQKNAISLAPQTVTSPKVAPFSDGGALSISNSTITAQAGASSASAVTVRVPDGTKTLPPMILADSSDTNQINLNYNAVGFQTSWQLVLTPFASLAPGTYNLTLLAQGNNKNYKGNITIIVTERPHLVASLQEVNYNPAAQWQDFTLTLQRIAGYSQPITNVTFSGVDGLACDRGATNDPSAPYADTNYFECRFNNGTPVASGTINVRVATPTDTVTTSTQFQFPVTNQ